MKIKRLVDWKPNWFRKIIVTLFGLLCVIVAFLIVSLRAVGEFFLALRDGAEDAVKILWPAIKDGWRGSNE